MQPRSKLAAWDAARAGPILVLGIGNLLWADEGFGVRALQALRERYHVPAGVTLLDGGTQGVYLLPYVASARRLLVLDAIDCGLPPGALRVLRGHEIAATLGVGKISLHQAGLLDLLALAALSDRAPEETVVIGAQPANLADFGGGLSAPVHERLADALELVVAMLASWGQVCPARRAGLGARPTVPA